MTVPTVARRAGRSACSICLARLAPTSSLQTLYRSSIHTKRKLHGAIVPEQDVQKHMQIRPQPSFQDYFSANESIDRGWIKNGFMAAWRTAAEQTKLQGAQAEVQQMHNASTQEQTLSELVQSSNTSQTVESVAAARSATDEAELPHRRRWRKKHEQSEELATVSNTPEQEQQLPLDASSQLTTAATSLPSSATLRRKFATYLSLTKPRLSFLIILTTTSAYSLYPIPEILSSTTSAVDASTTLSTSTLTLLFLTTGTFLSCASANTFNMLFEPKYDALMTRTRNRPLVRKLISQRAALLFALMCGASGLTLLNFGTNPTVAALSGLNIFLYGFVYTPMKRISAANTWIGAIVGGIPPLMGWAAAAGQAATSEHHSWRDLLLSEDSIGGWLLAGLLFAWQFPHFNSLSHTIRDDYKNAGHKMLAWINPARNARVALRYSVAMFPICAGLYYVGIVNQGFLAISTVCNLWMLREAIKFWKYQGAKGSARGLFWASVWQLPLVLVGALVCKTGIWDGFFGGNEPISMYDDEEDADEAVEARDGESLGMDNAVLQQITAAGTDHSRAINMAMLGFKRPS